MLQTTLFIDVILPLALPKLYSYRVPMEWNDYIKTGQRVVVQFGKQKVYTSLVRNIRSSPPDGYEAKYILSILDEDPVVSPQQFLLWDWMSSYYMCSLGEIMNAALPAALKLQSETRIILNPDWKTDVSKLSDKEYLLFEALQIKQVLSLSEATQIVNQKTVFNLIKTLIEKGAVLIEETLNEKYKPKIVSYVRLSSKAQDASWMKEIFDQLEKKSPKQLDLLMAYFHFDSKELEKGAVPKTLLLKKAGASAALLQALVKKEVFEFYDKTVDRLKNESGNLKEKSLLNPAQQIAFDQINETFTSKDVTLLHGVTSSGKTEIYIHLIEETIKQGKQVLYLLPEIALTTQIVGRLRNYFGNKVSVYHSRFNDNERAEVWFNLLKPSLQKERSTKIILGARSSLFLPFDNLGLIIVDEEHDSSYKQFDPSPRYNARDSAIYLAKLHKAKTLLGSATPSIESYFNSKQDKYGFVELSKRFGDMQLPEIILADVKEETRKKIIKSHFTTVLLDHTRQALEQGEQVILFQNRRGFAPFIECGACSWVPYCSNCDVSLTYHKQSNQLHCHYCGNRKGVPAQCGACGSVSMQMKGFGTEKIEEELAIFFPKARIARMDLDSTRAKNAYQQIISDFEDRKIDILVGTQMVTKGLDFDNVSTVGILNADSMINYPDFRAFERSYQQMAQVSGRAGRKHKRGKVIVQTTNPNYSVIQHVINNDYIGMYTYELTERRNFNYPPFVRFIELTLKHRDLNILNEASVIFANELRKIFGARVLGPEFPLIAKIKNLFLKTILLKIEKEASVTTAKKKIEEVLVLLKSNANLKGLYFHIDVDPL
jgi:primosomal protein N' (replication factor Y)